MSDEIMTLKEVAEYLKLKEKTAYRHAAEGILPGVQSWWCMEIQKGGYRCVDRRKQEFRTMTKKSKTYPVIDLFAGPGGLGEGFAVLKNKNGKAAFESVASIEMDKTAHDTLTLRHLFRCFREDQVPDAYYRYVSGEISKLRFNRTLSKAMEYRP